ncbi:MAG: phosphatidylglycerophosphatase A [Gammaproteobacteria bacterium]|jgi:phosphatidylglycerophosphatase A|nr:phosphatidylglycerophosphatase A [Gammaproteobacteria bacterium]MBT4495047.1 phosphatidylglycerophosphatase A [Gammaproteobacteria bacterium]MBT7371343.1 phosphatidylglycerophosphatase A [Gammaproteobacteria bacterium]
MAVDARQVFTRPDYFIACGFGSGLVPRAPGTAGSALGLVLFLPAIGLPIVVQIGLVVMGLVFGIYISNRVAAEIGTKDPAAIVWDEFIGMWIAMLWLPDLYWLPVAFVLFRLFDIVKPWPVSWADRDLEGGLGIMLDDVIAGLLALGSLQLLFYAYLQFL